MRRLTVTDAELAVTAEALREAMAAGLMTPASTALARELLDRIDAKLPSAIDDHPAGPAAGRVLAGDEILRLLLGREDRQGRASLSNEVVAGELSWKPAGTSVRSLLEDLRRGGWLLACGSGGDRLFELTRKGRGRARALQHAGAAPANEARISAPDELLDLIYADSTPATISFTGERAERIPGIWHRPTVLSAARLDHRHFCQLEAALRDAGMIGEQIHSYGTLTPSGEHHARERWHTTRLPGAFGPPPRLARPYQRAGSVIARMEDRACPSCGGYASWLARRKSKRWEELRGRGEADFSCPGCDVRWTIYLEPTGPDGAFDPLADPALCRPRWPRYALTPRLVAVAGQWLEHSELPRLATPFVALLHARTSLTAHLVAPSYDRVVCLVHSNEAGVPEPRLRELVPAHCTAGGKALLAARERWRRSLLSAPLRAYTERTLTEPSAVEREASATRERGYAIEDGEYRPGVRAVAAAVRDRAGNAIAAIGVSVAGDLDVETIGSDALRTAGELSTALVEYMPSQPARSPSR